MATPGVGQDIEDMCTRCGDTWHVVMAKVGDRVAKVVCKLCGSQHNYRGEKPAAPSGTTAKAWNRPHKRKPSRPGSADAKVTPTFDPNKPPRGYSPKDAYRIGERLIHSSFGTGVVAGSPGPGKVEVHFPTGERTLACAKVGSTLERPVAVQISSVPDSPTQK